MTNGYYAQLRNIKRNQETSLQRKGERKETILASLYFRQREVEIAYFLNLIGEKKTRTFYILENDILELF